MLIGDTAHLAFEMDWSAESDAAVAGLAWGGLRLWVHGQPLWRSSGSDGLLRWTWIDLVEHLARAWAHVGFEEVAPHGLVAAGPECLREPRLLASVDGVDSSEVEDAVHRFQHRHDLAAGLKGLTLPPVWLLREGLTMRVRAQGRESWLPIADALSTLERFVEVTLEHASAGQPRAATALQLWDARHPSAERALRLRTGMSDEELSELTPPRRQLDRFWGDPLAPTESSLMAAARLTRPLALDTRRQIVKAVSRIGWRETPELNALSAAASPVLETVADKKPYEQGYRMALWLRGVLKNSGEAIAPEELLADWGVELRTLPELERELDAVAVWGASAGPAVLLNPAGTYASSAAGRRATLAHEVAHLVLDRRRHLPAAEVFGGSTPLHLEQRARAFAAELLLPRALAARAVAESPSVAEASRRLRALYGVSKEVVAWQIRNGGAWSALTTAERRRVGQWCRGWR